MKSKTGLKNKVRLAIKPAILKYALYTGIAGAIIFIVFFIFNNLGTPKDSSAINLTRSQYHGQIIISEYAPNGISSHIDRFVELYNNSENIIDITGFELKYYKNSLEGTLQLSGAIMPDSFYLIAVDKDAPVSMNYDIKVPGKGWKLNAWSYLELTDGTYLIDMAGNMNDKLHQGSNYDRTDVLEDGSNVAKHWGNIEMINATPGAVNYSDQPAQASVFGSSSFIDFGSNDQNEPALKLKSNGTVHPGMTTVKIKRGKEHPNAINKSVKRYISISPESQPDNVELVYYYHDSELNGLVESELALYSYYENNWHYIGGIVDTVSNTITVDGVNHFSDWIAAEKGFDGNSGLPIELVSFNAKINNNSVELNWQTASEINNDYFSIERMFDDGSFEVIGTVKGMGTSVIKNEYSFIDPNPGQGTIYYRIKQTDYDGKFEYFKPVSVFIGDEKRVLEISSIRPNPFYSTFTVDFNSNKQGTAQIELYSMNGQKVFSKSINAYDGENSVLINEVDFLVNGYYLCALIQEGVKTKSVRVYKSR